VFFSPAIRRTILIACKEELRLQKCVSFALLVVFSGAGMLAAQTMSDQDAKVHLNQIQVIGSHNSYNLGFAPSEEKFARSHNPREYESLEYRHATLKVQLGGGVRQLEIDIVQDPHGGRFAHPKIVALTKQAGLPPDPDFDPSHEMDKPGFKVIHIPDLNQRSSCLLFTDCLKEIRSWSKSHPEHVPLFLLIETKHGRTASIPDSVEAETFTSEAFDALDKEIRSVFTDSEIILPDKVRGNYPTLEAAVRGGHWPTLAESRGKVIFLMDQKNAGPVYTAGHPLLQGRVLFTNSDPGKPDAAFVEENEGSPQLIDQLVRQGYIVRARADESTIAARTDDTTRRDALLRSGAQMISTDYPLSEPSNWTGYSVGFSDGLPARCNIINAPPGCKGSLLEPDAKSGGVPSPENHPVSQQSEMDQRAPQAGERIVGPVAR
jgi:Phosphoinositide phospholipase C, Ca2+-dependent